jgi:hypothetical protein
VLGPLSLFWLETDEEMGQWQREHEQRTAALMRERSGEPLIAHSAHLPSGLPPAVRELSARGSALLRGHTR